jgi:hypothetical protein
MDFRRGASHAAETAADLLNRLYLRGATAEDLIAFAWRFSEEVLEHRRIDLEFVLSDLAEAARAKPSPKSD